MKNRFNFKSIRTRILAGFAIIIVFMLLFGVYNIFSLAKTNNDMDELINRELELLKVDEQLAFNIAERVSLIRGYILFDNSMYKEQFNEGIESSIALENKALELSDSEQLQELIDKKIQWGQVTDRIFEEFDRGNTDEAIQILETDAQTLGNELIDGFSQLAAEREAEIEELGDTIAENGALLTNISVLISVVIIILGVVVAIIISNNISKPIKQVMERMKGIASGDLSQEPLDSKLRDETGQLVQATNEMNAQMKELLNQINEVSETVTTQSEELTQSANEVKTGAEQIATTMQELASGSETQANSASDLASVMNTFSMKVQEANENGEEISSSSKDVLQMTGEGTGLMNKSTKQMERIDQIVRDSVEKVQALDEQAQQISNLVTVIRDVADQTNLLALNAAIEAARAGEHGKGFAVVADEVRNLAEQTSESVTDITGIVTGIQNETANVVKSLTNGYKEVQSGTSQIETTNDTFGSISTAVTSMVSSIESITGNLSEIAASTQEMNSSIEEIASVSEEASAGVEQTSASTQQTSSIMEEVADSSEQLSTLAEQLNGLIRQFKL